MKFSDMLLSMLCRYLWVITCKKSLKTISVKLVDVEMWHAFYIMCSYFAAVSLILVLNIEHWHYLVLIILTFKSSIFLEITAWKFDDGLLWLIVDHLSILIVSVMNFISLQFNAVSWRLQVVHIVSEVAPQVFVAWLVKQVNWLDGLRCHLACGLHLAKVILCWHYGPFKIGVIRPLLICASVVRTKTAVMLMFCRACQVMFEYGNCDDLQMTLEARRCVNIWILLDSRVNFVKMTGQIELVFEGLLLFATDYTLY